MIFGFVQKYYNYFSISTCCRQLRWMTLWQQLQGACGLTGPKINLWLEPTCLGSTKRAATQSLKYQPGKNPPILTLVYTVCYVCLYNWSVLTC